LQINRAIFKPIPSTDTMADEKTPGELALIGQQLKELPASVLQNGGVPLTKLDLSDNAIRSGANFDKLTSLKELVLDKNGIETLAGWPVLNSVNTLWINNNKIKDVVSCMDAVVKSFPNVTYISMLRNPAVPDVYFSDGEAEAYQRFRYYVIHRLKKLQILDATPVTAEERKVADVKGKFYKVAKPVESAEDAKDEQVVVTKAAAPVAPGAKPPKVATFLAKGKPRYDGTNSEGNRFICNDDL